MKKNIWTIGISIFLLTLLVGCNKCGEIFWNSCSEEPACEPPHYELTLHEVKTTPSLRQVRVLFQVFDQNKNGVPGLTEANFAVLENKEFIDTEAGMRVDRSLIPSQLKTVLLLDISSSVKNFTKQIKDASIALIESKLAFQEFAIYTFDKDLKLVQNFTSDVATLKAKVNSIPSTQLENSTNLYGSIIELTNGSKFAWNEQFTTDKILERNLIVFTDGRHNANPSITLNQVLSRIRNKKVYVAALQSPDLREEPLKEIGNEGYFLAANINELEAKFKEVQENIRKRSESLYYMYYVSPISDPAPRTNSLEIRIKNNSNSANNASIKTSFNSKGFK